MLSDRGFTALFMNKKNFPLKNHYRVTGENFFDMFNRVHNPDYYYGLKKTKEKKQQEIIKHGVIEIYSGNRNDIFNKLTDINLEPFMIDRDKK